MNDDIRLKNQKRLIPNRASYCKIVFGDCREVMESLEGKAQLIITSPPYADARKKHYDSIDPDTFPEWFKSFHKPFYNALEEKGSFVLNIKDKIVDGVRNRYVWKTIMDFEEMGWKAIDDYLWVKTNAMPGRWPTRLRDGWEYCFHLSKTTKPYFYPNAVKVPIGEWTKTRLTKLTGKSMVRHNSENESGFGRDLNNWIGKSEVLPSNVLTLPLVGKNWGHPAVFPLGLPGFFIRLLTDRDGLTIDPFGGSGSTAIAAIKLHRDVMIIDNNKKYCEVAYNRIMNEAALNGTKVIKIGF